KIRQFRSCSDLLPLLRTPQLQLLIVVSNSRQRLKFCSAPFASPSAAAQLGGLWPDRGGWAGWRQPKSGQH
uniref:Uncharacterized protein n=1 Tax=Triticum urartu TaxID=4572 RepID=A0A8R7PD31_TRIUA